MTEPIPAAEKPRRVGTDGLLESITARRIMHARQLLHDVREEYEPGHRDDESRLRLLAGILSLLENPGSAAAGHPDGQV